MSAPSLSSSTLSKLRKLASVLTSSFVTVMPSFCSEIIYPPSLNRIVKLDDSLKDMGFSMPWISITKDSPGSSSSLASRMRLVFIVLAWASQPPNDPDPELAESACSLNAHDYSACRLRRPRQSGYGVAALTEISSGGVISSSARYGIRLDNVIVNL